MEPIPCKTRGFYILQVKMYTTRFCGFCIAAKNLLKKLGVEFEEIPLDHDPKLREEISKAAGGYSMVPMIFIDEQFIGGYTELLQIHKAGKFP